VHFEPFVQSFRAALVQPGPLKGDVQPLGGRTAREELVEALPEPATVILEGQVEALALLHSLRAESYGPGSGGNAESKGEPTLAELRLTGEQGDPLWNDIWHRPTDFR